MNIILLNHNDSISHILKNIQKRIINNCDLNNISDVSIKSLKDFQNLKVSNKDLLKKLSTNPAYYKISEKIIYINLKYYITLTDETKIAILIHEIAHHFIESAKYPKFCHYELNILPIGEDITADYLVCKWGFFDETFSARKRESDYGKNYANNLMYWDDKKKYNELMTKWDTKHNLQNNLTVIKLEDIISAYRKENSIPKRVESRKKAINFYGPTISYVDFSNQDLSNLDLRYVKFINCNFFYSKLNKIILDGSYFFLCNFINVECWSSEINHANFGQCNFERSKYMHCNFNGTAFPHSNFKNSTLYNCNFDQDCDFFHTNTILLLT